MPRSYRTTEQYVLNVLRNEILKGKYRPGDRLRQEEVAKQLEVSTTPVREAFRDLRSEGLVQIDANKGVVVRGLTVRDVEEIYELRILLEPLLARKAVAGITDDQLESATGLYRELCAASDPHAWSSLNNAFHMMLMSSQTGSRLHDLVKNLFTVAEPYVALSIFIHPRILEMDNEEHESILDATVRRDDAAVEALVRAHLERTRDVLLQSVNESSLRMMGTALA